MQTPDITPATIVALVQAVLGVALAFGLNLSTAQQGELLGLVAAVAGLLLSHDAVIRGNRAKHVAGPTADQQAASTILEAASKIPVATPDPVKAATSTLAAEADLEQQAHAANAEPGVDPATQG